MVRQDYKGERGLIANKQSGDHDLRKQYILSG